MRHRLSVLIVVLFFLLSNEAIRAEAVYISGRISADTTWSGEQVIMDTSVVIEDGVTLTIEPGVRIDGQRDAALLVHGTLLAEGKEQDSIIFSGSSDWRGIRFADVAAESDTSRLTYCHIENAEPDNDYRTGDWGGGITFRNWSKVVIAHTIITECGGSGTNLYGGGVRCESSSPLFRNCVFYKNEISSASGNGGAICCVGSSPTFINVMFLDNAAEGASVDGGGIYCEKHSSPLIVNCLFAGNYASGAGCEGGALVCRDTSNARVINCTFAYNGEKYTGDEPGEAVLISRSSPEFFNCIIAFSNDAEHQVYINDTIGKPRFYHCLLDTPMRPATSRIDTTGFFEQVVYGNPEFANPLEREFWLAPRSPCINAGTPDTAGLGIPDIDLAGNERVYRGERIDIGAYEYQRVVSSVTDLSIPEMRKNGHYRGLELGMFSRETRRFGASDRYTLNGRRVNQGYAAGILRSGMAVPQPVVTIVSGALYIEKKEKE